MNFRSYWHYVVLGSAILQPGVTLAQKSGPAVPHVLMISIDGMRPDYITHADEHGLKVPEMRKFLTGGTYAEGVVGVEPTVTLPSHTTMITGVWPIEHGIYDNNKFDPGNDRSGGWSWVFNDIKCDTLLQAAHRAGLTTAAISWPVTVGAPVDYLLANDSASEDLGPTDGAAVAPADLLTRLGKPPADRHGDDVRAFQTEQIIRSFNPNFVLLHFVELDHQEHLHGPFSPEADRTVEHLDGLVGEVVAAERAVDPDADILVVSDHGFAKVDHRVQLNSLFVQKGLITLSGEPSKFKGPKVSSWKAEAWFAGGEAAIMLHDPKDEAVKQQVRELLKQVAADPANGVDRVLEHDEIVHGGGFPDATFLVAFKEGWSSDASLTGPLLVDTPGIGTHGFLPDNPDMRSTFMSEGAHIALGRDLGVVDMRQIAPTAAALLHIELPIAKMKPLHVGH